MESVHFFFHLCFHESVGGGGGGSGDGGDSGGEVGNWSREKRQEAMAAVPTGMEEPVLMKTVRFWRDLRGTMGCG